jgi:acyl-CoA thioester hydrolase
VTSPARYDPRLLDAHRYRHRRVLETMFSDLDIQRHVNNVAILRFFEEGRSSLRRAVEEQWGRDFDSVVLARFEVFYLREVSYPGPVEVALGTGRIGTSSYESIAALFQHGHCAALCWSTDALRRADRSTKQPLADQARAALAQFAVALDGQSES